MKQRIAKWLLLLLPLMAAADVFDDMTVFIKNGNSKELSKFFNASIDLTTPTASDIYSKAQAEIVLKDFFVKYPPKAFSIQHRGSSSQGARYVIGNYNYGKGSFRVYILVKENSGVQQIQELRFENE